MLFLNKCTYMRIQDYLWGHAGYGGQNVKVDFRNGITMCYLTNGLHTAVNEYTNSFRKLQRAIYTSLAARNDDDDNDALVTQQEDA